MPSSPTTRRKIVAHRRDEMGQVRPVYEIECRDCGQPHQTTASQTKLCPACNKAHQHSSETKRGRRYTSVRVVNGKRILLYPSVCQICETEFEGVYGAKTCGPSCYAELRARSAVKLRSDGKLTGAQKAEALADYERRAALAAKNGIAADLGAKEAYILDYWQAKNLGEETVTARSPIVTGYGTTSPTSWPVSGHED